MYKDYEKRVLVHKREMDNQKYLQDELAKEWVTWTDTLGKAVGDVSAGSPATGLKLAKINATALKASTAKTYDNTTPPGKKQLEITERAAWVKKVTLAKNSASAVKVEFDAVMSARSKAE